MTLSLKADNFLCSGAGKVLAWGVFLQDMFFGTGGLFSMAGGFGYDLELFVC